MKYFLFYLPFALLASIIFGVTAYLARLHSRNLIAGIIREDKSYPVELMRIGKGLKAAFATTDGLIRYAVLCFSLTTLIYLNRQAMHPNELVFVSVFIALIVWLSWIDLASHLLPSVLVLVFALVGVMCSICINNEIYANLYDSLLALGVSSIVLYVFQIISWKMGGENSVGGGDTKFLIALSAWFGLLPLLFIITYACLGFIAAILYRQYVCKDRISCYPFGPFIAFGAWLHLMFPMDLHVLLQI